MSCEVCENEPTVGTAVIPGLATTVRWGVKCLDAGIVPLWAVVANTVAIGGDDLASEWWQGITDRTLTYFGKDRAWLDAEIEAKDRELNMYFANRPPDDEMLMLTSW